MILTSTRLGLIACNYLAEKYHCKTWTSAPEIAEKFNMNVRALMPALRKLTSAGILRSRIGGKEPGFIFVNDPKYCSLLDLLLVLEGSKFNVACCKDVVRDLNCHCVENNQCGFYLLINYITEEARRKLGSVSIVDYCKTSSI